MGRRLNHSTPTVINTELVPFDESFFISADGQLEQWYYDNSTTYAPNRKLTPLILTPMLSVYDKETTLSYGTDAGTLSFYTVQWYSLEYRDNTSDYAERPITNVTDDPTAEYVVNGFSLIVKKNVSYSHGVTIRCVATYIDPRDAGKTYTTQATVLLTTNRDAKVVLPEVSIISPSARGFNPLTDYDNQGHQLSQFEFKGAINNSPERASSTEVQAYRINGGGTEEILPDNNGSMETCAPVMDIVYPDGSVETDASFMFRKAGGGTKGGVSGTAYVTNIKGNTVRWNQLVTNGNFANGTNGWSRTLATTSVSNGVCTITRNGTATGSAIYEDIGASTSDTYYMSAVVKTADANNAMQLHFAKAGSTITVEGNSVVSTTSTTFEKISQITSPASSTALKIAVRLGSSSTPNSQIGYVKDVMCINLTRIFGTDAQIAEALEIQTTDIKTATGVAAFEAWLAKNVGVQSFYAQTNTDFVSVKSTGIRTVGFNIWDGTYSVAVGGNYLKTDGTTGNSTNSAFANYGVSNFIRVLPNTVYYQSSVSGSANPAPAICFYDENQILISGIAQNTIYSAKKFTTPAGTCYIKTTITTNTTVINISDTTKNGQSEAYWSKTASLPIQTMKGKLNGAGRSFNIFPSGMMSVNGVYDELTVMDGGALKAIKRCTIEHKGLENNGVYREDGDLYVMDGLSCQNWNLSCSRADAIPLCWSQMVADPIFDDVKFFYTVVNIDDSIDSKNGVAEFRIGGRGDHVVYTQTLFGEGHKFLIRMSVRTDERGGISGAQLGQMTTQGVGREGFYASFDITDTWQTVAFITSAYSSAMGYNEMVGFSIPSNLSPSQPIQMKELNCIDLTATYGAGNEPTVRAFNLDFTASCYGCAKENLAFKTTRNDIEDFDAFIAGASVYAVLDTPSEFIVDDYSVPADFVWFGMNNNTETRAEQLPWYVSGQGTDTLTVDAMWGEEINVVLRCTKNSATDELSPSKAYAAVTWRIPDVDTGVVSKNGSAVRSDSTSFLFDTICNCKGITLTDTVKNAHLRFNWKRRKSDTTTEYDCGWGQTVTLQASDLVNSTSGGTQASTQVYPYPYLLGAWEPQDSTDPVAYSQPTTTKNGVTYVRKID